MTALTDITAQLAEPFSLDDIDLLPKGKIERDGKTLCMALPYADPRVYQDRLNQLAPGEWETPAPIALTVGDKLVTYVTVFLCGVVHTDVGEAGPGENQGTEAWAQAFKRACSQFGLGRYLYDLEKEWVPYIAQGKSGKIDLDGAGKRNVVRKMYQKAEISVQAQPRQLPPVPGVQPDSYTPINAPTPRELRERHKFLQMNDSFEVIVKKIFKRDLPDDALSPEQCIALSGVLERVYEEKQASRKEA